MNNDEKLALLEAVNLLIASPDAHELFGSMEALAPVAARHPVKLTGAAAVLNTLLTLKAKDQEAYDRVLGLIERRRGELGYDALRYGATDPTFCKADYMRGFMEQKRERQRVAVETENLVRGDRDKLIGNARLEFMRRQSVVWKEQRDTFLERARSQAGGKLTKEQTQRALEQFWSTVDADLEVRRRQAVEESLKPRSARRPPNASLASLVEALEFDPYKK